ncbi:MAG: hypothetical protein AAF928_08035 [Myxococcota bacterium]
MATRAAFRYTALNLKRAPRPSDQGGIPVGPPPPADRQSPWGYLGVAVVTGAVGWFVIGDEDDNAAPSGRSPSTEGTQAAADADPGGGDGPYPPRRPNAPRCRAHGPADGYTVRAEAPVRPAYPDATSESPSPSSPPAPRAPAAPPLTGDDDDDDATPPWLPFSVALGRGVALTGGAEGGYAVGVKRERDGATWAEVAVVEANGGGGRLIGLSRSRGDVDAPLVVGGPRGWVAGFLEPHAGGLDLRLVGPDGEGGLTWGTRLPQGRDASLAFDVALGPRGGIAAWDEVTDDRARGTVTVASIEPETLVARGEVASRSGEEVDAELPRVVRRGEGFWLFYIARDPVADGDDGERLEGRFAAERIVPSWVEVVPLDAGGAPTGAPLVITGRDGHVLAYDVAPGAEGGAVVVWRDDDTPSGAHGGDVFTVAVGPSGPGAVQPVSSEAVGAGVPDLEGEFLALTDARGRLQLAPFAPTGIVTGPLQREPRLGRGQLVAAAGPVLLVAQPRGRDVTLFTVACDPSVDVAPP